MWFSSWLRYGKRSQSAQRRRTHGPARQRATFRPMLEALEDRCVPSTLAVTNPVDDVNVQGTLRYDIAHAQSGDTILLTGAVQSGIVLTQGELVLNQNVTIETASNQQITISGGGNSRVFEVAAGANVTLANLAITDGNGVGDNPDGTSQDSGIGGGILNLGTLTVLASNVSGNSATGSLDFGGGIANFGDLTVSGSTLSGNSARGGDGGGIWNFGDLTVSGSTLSGN